MSNKKKTREAESAANMANAQATAAASNVKLTDEAKGLLSTSSDDFRRARGGDVTQVGAVSNFLQQSARQNEARRRVSPTGAASLAFSNANPTLLAMNSDMLDRQQAQDTALGVTGLAMEAEDTAASRIAALSGMDLSARAQQANFLLANASRAWDRYQFEANKRSFWQDLTLGAVGAAGSVFSGAFK